MAASLDPVADSAALSMDFSSCFSPSFQRNAPRMRQPRMLVQMARKRAQPARSDVRKFHSTCSTFLKELFCHKVKNLNHSKSKSNKSGGFSTMMFGNCLY